MHRKVLIFDFGGGTLDIVILVIERGMIDIKAVGGDNHLGGDDIDNNMAKYCLEEFSFKTNIMYDKNTEEFEKALRRLTIECEKKKRSLCGAHSVFINLDSFYKRKDLSIELKREKFEELNDAIFKKSMDLVEQVLEDAKLKHEEIDDIVLVGGTTRILKIQTMLSELFFGKRLNHSVNPDEAVAIGAAIQAAILNGALAHDKKFLKVSDVAPMSLGVEVTNGFMSVIIHRNSKVPAKYTKIYETTCDNQQEVEVKIYEGEETMASDNRLLGEFVIQNIPRGHAGEQKFMVTFDINDEGILHVTAQLLNSDEEHGIRITEHKGRLSDNDLAEMMNRALN
jgi:L1 cell adhesion molecule like protein